MIGVSRRSTLVDREKGGLEEARLFIRAGLCYGEEMRSASASVVTG
jgi:hypothetical protein